jgi:glycosyltransferase involved in cell wall biosynthesis
MGRSSSLPAVSVVIPTRGDRAELLRRSLDRLLNDSATPEIIVVLDRGTDGINAGIEQHKRHDERVKVVTAPRSELGPASGAGAARDLGATLAQGEVILALDDDVEPRPGLVEGHARRHLDADDLVVVGYMPVSSGERLRGQEAAAARLYSESYERACEAFQRDPTRVLLGLWGGNLSVRRSQWLRAADRPRVPAGYHADLDLGLRLREGGLRGTFDPSLRAEHHYRRSAGALLKAARSSGFGQEQLHAAYPDVVGAPADDLRRRRATRLILWLSQARSASSIGEPLLLSLARVAAAVNLSSLEYSLVKALWALGFASGIRDANANRAE